MITHCAQWVAKHGTSFESVLRTKNAAQPGWGFLVPDGSDANQYYRVRVAYEVARGPL